MTTYHRLNLVEREELSRYLILDYSYRQIALCLNRSASTIVREIHRNKVPRWIYRAVAAQQRARRIIRQSRRRLKLDTNECLRTFVLEHLKLR